MNNIWYRKAAEGKNSRMLNRNYTHSSPQLQESKQKLVYQSSEKRQSGIDVLVSADEASEC